MPISLLILSTAVACVWAGMKSKFSFLFLFLVMLALDYCYWIQLNLFSQWVGLEIFSPHILFNPIPPFVVNIFIFTQVKICLLSDFYCKMIIWPTKFFLNKYFYIQRKILHFSERSSGQTYFNSFKNILGSIRFEYYLCVLFQIINGQSSKE